MLIGLKEEELKYVMRLIESAQMGPADPVCRNALVHAARMLDRMWHECLLHDRIMDSLAPALDDTRQRLDTHLHVNGNRYGPLEEALLNVVLVERTLREHKPLVWEKKANG